MTFVYLWPDRLPTGALWHAPGYRQTRRKSSIHKMTIPALPKLAKSSLIREDFYLIVIILCDDAIKHCKAFTIVRRAFMADASVLVATAATILGPLMLLFVFAVRDFRRTGR
jgi:hypothetical protein